MEQENQINFKTKTRDTITSLKHDTKTVKSGNIAILVDMLNEYRITNKNLVKSYTKKYLCANIRDSKLLTFMLNALKNENVNMGVDACFDDGGYNENNDAADIVDDYMQIIRRNHRWFIDVMLYLNEKYNERQLLNSEFAKVIKNHDVVQTLIKNEKIIDCLSKNIAAEYTSYKQKITDQTKENIQHRIK